MKWDLDIIISDMGTNKRDIDERVKDVDMSRNDMI